MAKTGIVVAHTHWDREWYQPFQGFRRRLVHMMDDLVETMEADSAYKYFFFDGQTIVLEDYLEVRPQQSERLSALIQAGRIEIGPWYVMPDEFLVSGESLVRNFLYGFRSARSFGVEPTRVGYVCDIFGHCSQFPQILRKLGIPYAVASRGFVDNSVPAELEWEAPDGSRVLTAKLDSERSYSDFYFAVRWPFDDREYDPAELEARTRGHLAHKDGFQSADVYLLLEGVDHIEVEPKLPWILATLNERIPEVELVHGRMTDYFRRLEEAAAASSLPVVYGEQIEPGRRGVNNQVLANVWSSRVDLKRRNHACQVLLESWAEPLSVYAAWCGKPFPQGFLRVAWRTLLQNHPHDSICGCSISQVHRDMHYRFDQVELLGEEMVREAERFFVDTMDSEQLPGDRRVTVFSLTDASEERVHVFELAFGDDERVENILLYDEAGTAIPYQILDSRRWIEKYHRPRRLIQFLPLRLVRVAARVAIPSHGYRTFGYEARPVPPLRHGQYTHETFVPPVRYPGSHVTGPASMENDRLRVNVNRNGTLRVEEKDSGAVFDGLLMLEDRGEIGDGWNYRRPEKDAIHTSADVAANVSVEHDGPLVTTLRISLELRVPRSIDESGRARSDALVPLPVEHRVRMTAGSSCLEVTTVVDNRVTDHILKVLFPSARNTDRFVTNTPFDLVSRSFARPDRSDYVEPDAGVSPSQGFMCVEDEHAALAAFTRGLYEYEAYDDASRSLALTLMRCFRKEVGTHGGTDGQLQGEQRFEYALWFGPGGTDRPMREYRRHDVGTRSRCSLPHAGTLPTAQSFLKHGNAAVQLSCLKRAEDAEARFVLRWYNTTDAPQEDTLELPLTPERVWVADLDERPSQELPVRDGTVTIRLGPKEVLTLVVGSAENG